MIEAIVIVLAVLVVLGVVAVGRSVRVVQQFEQGIVFRFARSLAAAGRGTEGDQAGR
jgi:regulator of protease activity HflC (stomatin/prohibitin superfamily)